MVNTTARGVFTEDGASFQIPEGCIPMTISYTVSGDMSGIDVARSFNMFDLDPDIDVYDEQRPSISVTFDNNTKVKHPYAFNKLIRHNAYKKGFPIIKKKPKTIYEKIYKILDKECPSWHYNIKELIEKSN